MYRAARRDANEQEIICAAQNLGASVVQLDAAGIPDLLIGLEGHNFLVEIKTSAGKLTFQQQQFFKTWKGQAAVIRTPEELKELLLTDASTSATIIASFNYGLFVKTHIY